jgi:hypothetical protein
MYSDGKVERYEAELERREAKKTKSRRTSFKNELTVRYGSKYRDPTNEDPAADGQVETHGESLWHHCSLHVWAKSAFGNAAA